MGSFDENYFVTDDYSETGADPLIKAQTFAKSVRNDVLGTFKYLREEILGAPSGISVDESGNFVVVEGDGGNVITSTMNAIVALMDFDFELPANPIVFPQGEWNVELDFELPEVNTESFGNLSPWTLGNAPSAGSLPSIDSVTIPTFTPSISSINIPDAPIPSALTDPGDAPDNPGFSYPSAPVITLPDRPVLSNVVIPEFDGVDLPTLADLTFPDLPEMNINTYINWSEPTYSPEIWTEVKAQIERFFAGGSGIRPEVEEAMVARGRDREDRLVRQQEQQATEEWAGRGYTAPPGMLAKRLDNIREEGLIKKLGLQREVVLKAMDEELTNIRLAVQQGIVAEQMWVSIFLAATERLFLVERLHVEWEIQKYNLLVEVFKAKFQENLIRAQIFEVQVRAALAEIEVFKALVDAERAKAEINQSLIQAYTAEIQARESLVNIYRAQVEAVGVKAQVFETEVRAYGQEVAAFAQRVNADKLRFDAYDSQIRGEVSKANIVEAEARAYQAEISGIDTGVRAQVAALEGYVSGFRAEIDAYEAQLRAHVGKNQAELAALQGNVAGYEADTQRFIAETGAQEARSRVNLAAWETQQRFELQWFETQMKEFELTVNKLLGQKALIIDALKAAGTLSSTIAAGGLAGLHASAAIQGTGSLSGQGSDSRQLSNSTSTRFGCSTTHGYSIPVAEQASPPTGCPF